MVLFFWNESHKKTRLNIPQPSQIESPRIKNVHKSGLFNCMALYAQALFSSPKLYNQSVLVSKQGVQMFQYTKGLTLNVENIKIQKIHGIIKYSFSKNIFVERSDE